MRYARTIRRIRVWISQTCGVYGRAKSRRREIVGSEVRIGGATAVTQTATPAARPAPIAAKAVQPSAPAPAKPAAPSAAPRTAVTPQVDLDALDSLDALDELELDTDLEILDEAIVPHSSARPRASVEIELETEVPKSLDEDGFFDRSGNDLSAPNPDEDLG